jgi:glucose-1-phosphate cytidylyltransferase
MMKVLILAGGLGTRIGEDTAVMPKPMIPIGGKPILWHIMKHYARHGFTEFVLLLGYKGHVIKEYFANYFLHQHDITIDIKRNTITTHSDGEEDWRVTMLDTGQATMTGGRIRRAREALAGAPFLLTYGDGVSDVDITKLVEFHRGHRRKLTLTAVQPEGRFGILQFGERDGVTAFQEKPRGDNAWINGGFFVCENAVLDEIDGDPTVFEREPMERLAAAGEVTAYRHEGFWQCMDTLRDKVKLQEMWDAGAAPWRTWA